jgi:hypothetical protein
MPIAAADVAVMDIEVPVAALRLIWVTNHRRWVGAHYCVDANLARLTIDLMFGAIADYMPDLTSVATPELLRHGWLNGIKHWQVDYTGGGLSRRTLGDPILLGVADHCANDVALQHVPEPIIDLI